jgi:hypothetical protein
MTVPDCQCDSPFCEKSWICARLGKLRIAYAILEEFQQPPSSVGHEIMQALHQWDTSTTKGTMDRIEWECEALCK